MNFDTAVAFVLKWEGGVSDDQLDPGKLTKWGISSKLFPEVCNAGFSQEQAIAIYKGTYWNACKCDELPAPLAFVLLDAAVNQGQPTAIRMLQRTLGVPADGVVGPETIRAAQAANTADVLRDFCARRAFAYACVLTVQRFGLGWMKRVMDCFQQAATLDTSRSVSLSTSSSSSG